MGSQADSEFERKRCDRLLEQQNEARKQAEELLTRNGQYQSMITNLQVLISQWVTYPPRTPAIAPWSMWHSVASLLRL